MLDFPELPIFYLGDFDPFGLDILLNYMFGSITQIYENSNVPTIVRIGLDFRDLKDC